MPTSRSEMRRRSAYCQCRTFKAKCISYCHKGEVETRLSCVDSAKPPCVSRIPCKADNYCKLCNKALLSATPPLSFKHGHLICY